MNAQFYLAFFNWWMSIQDGILVTKLYLMLRCTEVIALLCVLSMLHIAICLPTQWLAGKTHKLAEYGFGYYDMGEALDLMEAKPSVMTRQKYLMKNSCSASSTAF
jgi:hypothetical protein